MKGSTRKIARARGMILLRVAACVVCAACVGCAGNCCCSGYRIGPQGLYNSEIKTVFVPMVEADTYRLGFAERLTEAICKKVTEQTPYALASPDVADSILAVRLISENQTVSAFNRYDDTRQKNVNLTAVAMWRDLRDANIVAPTNPAPLNEKNGVLIESQAFLVPEMGQSTATAQQEAIDKLANEIVGLMEQPW